MISGIFCRQNILLKHLIYLQSWKKRGDEAQQSWKLLLVKIINPQSNSLRITSWSWLLFQPWFFFIFHASCICFLFIFLQYCWCWHIFGVECLLPLNLWVLTTQSFLFLSQPVLEWRNFYMILQKVMCFVRFRIIGNLIIIFSSQIFNFCLHGIRNHSFNHGRLKKLRMWFWTRERRWSSIAQKCRNLLVALSLAVFLLVIGLEYC